MIEEEKKPEQPPKRHKTRFIVKRSSLDEFTFADVRATVARPEQTDSSHFYNDLVQAVTAWVKCDPEAMSWWKDTSEDANIGDLAGCLTHGVPECLRRELEKVGIHGLEIETFCHNDTPADWTYDSHLVDSGMMEEAESEED